MALPDIVKGEVGRVIAITWLKRGTNEPQPITGATLTGTIRNGPGPTYTTRAVAGALAVSDGPNGTLNWTLHATDSAAAGFYEVQIIATIGSNVLKTFYMPWSVLD